MSMRPRVFVLILILILILMLCCGSAAQAATYCATTGNQLNIALNDAGHNGEDDDIRVSVGTHITDYHFPTGYQWSLRNTGLDEFDKSVTISGGWNGANNCQTQITQDPSQTVLDARYWGPVFLVLLANSIPGETYSGTFAIRNMTFDRGQANFDGHTTGLRILDPLAGPGSIVVDNVHVVNGKSAFQFTAALNINVGGSGSVRLRNSIVSSNNFTGANSTPVFIGSLDSVIAYIYNNSVFGNSVTSPAAGMHVWNIANVSNNAIADNVSSADPYYQYFSDAPTQMTLRKNHFGSEGFFNGAPFSEVDTTTGNPAWSQVGVRMVPDAVSPLRDSGDNAPLGGVPVIDFSGNPRIVNGTIDRGAVEADAPPASEVGPIVTAVSPANGSTTVFQGPIGSGFAGTQLTFDVSGGVAPGVTELECSVSSGDPLYFGIGSSGETVGVGESITPIDVGFNDITSEPQTATVTCAVIRELAGTSYLTFNFVAVPPGGPAVYDSIPKKYPDPAHVIDLTPGPGAIVGTDLLGQTLTILNVADLGDSDMQVSCGPSGGSNPQVTITPSTFNGDLIAPQGALQVLFDCDTSVPGSYFANWGCSYDLDDTTEPFTADGTSFYRVECDVRPPPETHVETTPPSGTTTTKAIGDGDSANFDFSFAEVSPDPDPPADANLLDCSIVGDTYGAFSIQSPSFPGGPYPIVNGSPVAVQVLGTDTSGQSFYTATLHCEYTDTDHLCQASDVNAEQGQEVVAPPCGVADFPLELQVRNDARFRVTKDFTDGNPMDVDVHLSCNTGLPLEQIKAIHEGYDVEFVIVGFDSGEMDCEVFEAVPDGYSPAYAESVAGDASLSDHSSDDEGCHFEDIEFGDFECQVTNTPDPVDVDVEKRWIFENADGDEVNTYYKLTLFCDGEIVDADEWCSGGEAPTGQPPVQQGWCKVFEGDGSDVFSAAVIPDYPYTHCYVVEDVYDDAVEVDNGCQDLQVSAGNGDSCVIENTVFFEGIPTLSQWGLAILALLMLGVGLVGFRRL